MKKIVTFLTITLSFCSILLSEITIVESGSEKIILNFNLGEYSLEPISINSSNFGNSNFGNSNFTKIYCESDIVTQDKGFAEMPFFSVAIQIDPLLDYQIKIINSEFIVIQPQYPIAPSPGIIYRNSEPTEAMYNEVVYSKMGKADNYFPEDFTTLSAPYIFRDIRGTNLRVTPFQYNYYKNSLRVYTSITLELIPLTKVVTNPQTREVGKISEELNSIYDSIFLNYDPNRYPLAFGEAGAILVIYTARDEAAIASYMDWKRQMGFTVYKDEVASGINIKDVVMQQFEMNPEIFYVLIVGDWSDLMSDLGTDQEKPMDPQLGCVVGIDDYPDLAVGRLSAKTQIDIQIQVGKIIQYEKYATTTDDWYGIATGIGSNAPATYGDDNEQDWEHLDVIWENKLSNFTFTDYTPIYDPYATIEMVDQAFLNGTSLINYTGHGSLTSWGTSGYDIYNIEEISNLDKYPVIISVACDNGDFSFDSVDCLAEKFLKKNGGGAVFMLASSISQPWAPPMRGQDYMMDILTGGYDYNNYPDQSGISTDEQRSTIGSIVLNAMILMITESDEQSDWETIKTWTSFGDPCLQMRTVVPKKIFATNDIVIGNEPFSTVIYSGNFQPEQNTWVTLCRGEINYSGFTDENGYVSISHLFPEGAVDLTITCQNCQTISQELAISPTGAYISLQMVDILEEEDSQDGYLQPLDILDLNIIIQNVGNVSTLGDVTGTIFSPLDNVTILEETFSVDMLNPGDIIQINNAFKIKLESGIYSNNKIPIHIFFESGVQNWHDSFEFEITLPQLHLSAWSLDVITGDDEVWNQGEDAELTLEITNSGDGVSYDIIGIVVPDEPGVSVNSSLNIPSLFPLETGNGENPVSLSLLENCPNGLVNFNLNLTDALGTITNAVLSIPVGIYLETFESGILNWDHYKLEEDKENPWHLSNTRNHTFGGEFSAKCGSEDDSDYCNNILAALETPEFDLQNTSVTFYHFMNTLIIDEASWDGGYLELSVNNGDFFPIEPEDGYPCTIIGFEGIPFDMGTPVFAGDINWEKVTVDLSEYSGIGKLRFVFGSSESWNTGEGWYLDDLEFNYSVDNDESEISAVNGFMLTNHPNPFNPTTIISFQLSDMSGGELVEIEIYNVKGQHINEFIIENLKAKINSVIWNGKDYHGNLVSSGVYFYILKVDDKVKTSRKMLLLK